MKRRPLDKVRPFRLGVLGLFALLGVAGAAQAQGTPASWPFAGADFGDTHAAYSPNVAGQLAPSNAGKLAVKWTFRSHDSISATPTVEPGGLYVPDWSGYLYKVSPDSGALIWSHKLSDYTGNSASFAKDSPAIAADSIVFGDRAAGRILSVNKWNGSLNWSTLVDAHPYAAITSSPVILNGVVYVGITSNEENAAVTAGYVPTFRGSVAALDLASGRVLWKFTTVPWGYSGGGVWGSSLAISPLFQSIFVTTGNNYGIPQGAANCVASAGSNVGSQLSCLDPTDYVDAVLALDIRTGSLKWSRRFQGADTWTVGCLRAGRAGCPYPAGPDADFGAAANMVALQGFYGVPDDRGGNAWGWLLGAAQKSGTYWGINPGNGGVFWSNHVNNASFLWGAAAGNLWSSYYLFVGIDNGGHSYLNYPGRVGGGPVGWNGGGWLAINAYTGKTVWQVPGSGRDLTAPQYPANAPGFVSFSNGLVFAGDTGGTLFAIDASTGYVFWTYATGATVESAPAVYNNTLYWGVGYPSGVGGNTLYAFAVP